MTSEARQKAMRAETCERAKAERRRRGLVEDAAFIDEASVYFPGEGYRKVTLPPMGELKE